MLRSRGPYSPGSERGQVAVVAYLVPQVVDLDAASPPQCHLYGHSTAANLGKQDRKKLLDNVVQKLYTAFFKVY